MPLPSGNINYLAVLVAGAAGIAVGAVWYSPFLFGGPWMRLMNFASKDSGSRKTVSPKAYAISSACAVVIAWGASLFIHSLGGIGAMAGMRISFWLWLGFVVTTMGANYALGRKPFQLYLIDVFHYFFSFLAIGAVLGSWY